MAENDKRELRRQVRQAKKQYSASELQQMSEPIITALLNDDAVMSATTIMLYSSLSDEVDTHRLIDILSKEGKTVLLPVVTDDATMELRQYHDERDMKEGAFGIMEPTGEVFSRYDSIDTAVVPGMAFDAEGNRLGRGKGYYDRFLSRMPQVYKIGICFPFQMVESVPHAETDIKMNKVISL